MPENSPSYRRAYAVVARVAAAWVGLTGLAVVCGWALGVEALSFTTPRSGGRCSCCR